MKKYILHRWASICGLVLVCGVTSADPLNTLIVGGGTYHDFQRWFNLADKKLLESSDVIVDYTEKTSDMKETIAGVDVLYLSNNKPFEDQASKDAIVQHLNEGKGMLLVHSALWYSWRDWPEFNRDLAGGGARGHDRLGPFTVDVVDEEHPVMKGVPVTFEITDELYYQKVDPRGPGIEVLATAYSKIKNDHYPSVFIIKHPKARVVGITLGHDGQSHSHEAYQTILKNALKWGSEKP